MGKANLKVNRRDFVKGSLGLGALTVFGGAAFVGLPSCSPAEDEVLTGTATQPGFGGDVTVTLGVQKKDSKIVSAKIEGDHETPDVGGRAVEIMPDRLIEAGHVSVDGMSGATVTSSAILAAASMAYDTALNKEVGEVRMKPGQYTASALGYWQIWDLPVTITVSETALLKIEVPEDRFEHGETEVILQSVKDELFPRMIENQSVAIDAVSGATVSSNAVKDSVETALKEALVAGGSDESAIRHFYAIPEKEQEEVEEIETDVLVVGMSTGGIMAFRNASEVIQSLNGDKRVSVLAIDKAGKYGGRSALTHEAQSVNPPKYIQTHNNGELFIDVDEYLEKWFKYVKDENGELTAKEEVIRTFVAESGATVDWLVERGWHYGTMTSLSKVSGGLLEFNTALSSNVDKGTYEDRRLILEGYYKGLLSGACAQGAKYMLEIEGYELVYDEANEAVVGVKARNTTTGQEYLIHTKAVVMGTGGFGNNEELMSTLLNPKWSGIHKNLGTSMDTGLMIQAALDIGAGTFNADMSPIIMHVGQPRYLNKYPINFKEDVLIGRTGRFGTWTLNDIPLGMTLSADTFSVDREGKRFGDESGLLSFAKDLEGESYCSYVTGPYFYSIHTQEQVDEWAENGFTTIPRWEGYVSRGGVPDELPLPEIYECLDASIEEGLVWKADTIEELAQQIDMETSVLKATMEDYNKSCEAGVDNQFGKAPELLKKYGAGPYYAVKVMNVAFATAGGLDVDGQIRVLKADGETPIKGLYAIGCDSLGVLLNPKKNYTVFPGIAQGWNQTAGRLAGENAARYVGDAYGFAEVTGVLFDLDSHTV